MAAQPASVIRAPWAAPALDLLAAGVTIGGNHAAPVVAHDTSRLHTLERYAVVKEARGA
jgi:deoxyribodipyrimidine photo-lyase